MPALPTPKSFSLRQLPRLDSRWSTVPTHRRLDARDVLLEEGLRLVDLRSPFDGYPLIENISKVAPDVSNGAYTGVVISGTNLLGGATKGSATFGSGTSSLTIENVVPGRNPVTFSMVSGNALSISANRSTRTIVVTFDGNPSGGLSTANAIATAINSDNDAKYLVNATGGGTGTSISAVAATDIEGTSGATVSPGFLYDAALLIGGTPITGTTAAVGVLDWTDSAITFDMDASGLTAGYQYPVVMIVDGVQTLAGFMTAVA
jgi:hypothetical protein